MYTRTVVALLLGFALALPAQGQKRGLDVYCIDTEGGQSTLIVTPERESVLIDSGNPGRRDAARIHHVAADVAGLKRIDHIITTHWHLDHYGGHGDLAKLMPVVHFYDHGIPAQSIDDPDHFPALIAAYKEASRGHSTTLKPGDRLPLRQAAGAPALRMTTICGMQKTIPDRPGAPANPVAKEFKPGAPDPSDNANSLGFVLQYGGWRFLDLGDLTWNTEYKLIAPTDKIGPIDVYLTTHHGLEISNNPVLIKTVLPTVAVFNNGPRKGGHPDVTRTLRATPSVKAIWQLHRNLTCAPDMNTSRDKIANWEEECKAEFIKLSVAPDAKSYTVQIGPRGKPERYATKR
jgi:beta-lactamase superfamily II metal-dependent hydrolase